MTVIDRAEVERQAAALWDKQPALHRDFPQKSTYVAYVVAVKEGRVNVTPPSPGLHRATKYTHGKGDTRGNV